MVAYLYRVGVEKAHRDELLAALQDLGMYPTEVLIHARHAFFEGKTLPAGRIRPWFRRRDTERTLVRLMEKYRDKGGTVQRTPWLPIFPKFPDDYDSYADLVGDR